MELKPRPKEKLTVKQFIRSIIKIIGILFFSAVLFFNLTYGGVKVQKFVDTMILGITNQNITLIVQNTVAITMTFVIAYAIQYVICSYFIKSEDHRYAWVESLIWIPLSLSALIIHTGGNYYIEDLFVDTSVYDNYYQDANVDYENSKDTNNLITIYIEQMEGTYSDKEHGGFYDINYIPNLTKLSEENITFSNTDKVVGGAVDSTGCDLTSGGLISTSVGLPLHGMTLILGHKYQNVRELFNGIDATGDILHNLGYYNEFICGTDAVFGSRKSYFSTHSYDNIIGVYELKNKYNVTSQNINNFNGINDHQLFEIAKQELQEVTSQNDKFNFTIMTLDTHFPGEYRCEYCGNTYGGSYGNVLTCVDNTVYNFIEWCKTQEWYDNTTIVITGDHTYMIDSEFLEPVDKSDYTRTVYNCFINSKFDKQELKDKGLLNNRQFVQTDMFPTILQSIGVDCQNKAGLGTSLESGEKTLVEAKGFKWYETQANLQSDTYNELLKQQ